MKTTMRNTPELGTKGSGAHGTERPVGQIVLVLQGGGALVAGNEPASRRARLQDFWSRIGNGKLFDEAWIPTIIGNALAGMQTLTHGVTGFFQPNPHAAWNLHMPVG